MNAKQMILVLVCGVLAVVSGLAQAVEVIFDEDFADMSDWGTWSTQFTTATQGGETVAYSAEAAQSIPYRNFPAVNAATGDFTASIELLYNYSSPNEPHSYAFQNNTTSTPGDLAYFYWYTRSDGNTDWAIAEKTTGNPVNVASGSSPQTFPLGEYLTLEVTRDRHGLVTLTRSDTGATIFSAMGPATGNLDRIEMRDYAAYGHLDPYLNHMTLTFYVPEPAAVVFAGLGLLALDARRRS